MRIRKYTPADLDDLHRLHAAQSFGYPFPHLDSPLFIAKLVLEEDEHADAPLLPSGPELNSQPASSSTDFSLWGLNSPRLTKKLQTEQSAEKLQTMSFRGALRAEESAFPCELNEKQIPRFARNESLSNFF